MTSSQLKRNIRADNFSAGFVSVPREDVRMKGVDGGYLLGFSRGNRSYCFECQDPIHPDRILYRDVTTDGL